MHIYGDLKRLTIENIEEYVVKDNRLATLFNRMHENNAKVFLLTNSGFDYTDVSIPSYLAYRISYYIYSFFIIRK